ncbi:PREDICTED: probable protein phosphatase DDB_G0282105 [Nicotiana attenuata]|uniref:probable protein phosphatase DDB_G0282105 n=1 Tax=Nicotiana attenuata TaxID=49451 RepID=UPI00090596D5|nr:PREDICTED: probable protein phosphatase DDB_G0282105 [Nicotiana attenuata]
MAVETEATKYDSLFALMAQSDDDEEDENDEVNSRDVQRNLKSYSSKKLMSLTNVLIDAYYILINDKDILTIELGDAEQSRDDLVVCVVDLNKTIAKLEIEKEALNEKLNSVENERDDLMVVVVDLKETIESFSNEKHTLEEKIAATEQERDDFLVIITDLEETIEGVKSELRPASIEKGKEVASETHIKLEKELNNVKTSLCSLLEKNRQLQAELERVKIDLEKSLKWKWSSKAVTAMYLNNSGNRHGVGFQKEKIPYNPHSKVRLSRCLCLCREDPHEDGIENGITHNFSVPRTQCVKESVHVLFNETPSSNKGGNIDVLENEALLVLGEVSDVSNSKADMMSQMKEIGEDNTTSSSTSQEGPGTPITTTEAVGRVGDVSQGTPQVVEQGVQRNPLNLPSSSNNQTSVLKRKHKSFHPLDNIITPLRLDSDKIKIQKFPSPLCIFIPDKTQEYQGRLEGC